MAMDSKSVQPVIDRNVISKEISQIEGVEWAAAQFQDQGATVHYQQYKGGHAIARWRAELPAALCWLLAAQQVDNGVHSQGIS